MSKIPAFQFYPADWRKDLGVQSLSFHDRGIWFEILCLMHESEQRGKLLLNGRPMPDEVLARLLGLDKQILTKTLTTLIDFGVASRDKQGALINRRMIKDENLRQIRTESGKKGGNPNLVNQNSTKPEKQVNQNSTPSSSSSSSSSLSQEAGAEIEESKPVLADTPDVTNNLEWFENQLWLGLEERQVVASLEYESWKQVAATSVKFGYSPPLVLACFDELQKDPTRKYRVKPERVLMNLADYSAKMERESGNAKSDWQTATQNCSLCDEKGLRNIGGKLSPCDHK